MSGIVPRHRKQHDRPPGAGRLNFRQKYITQGKDRDGEPISARSRRKAGSVAVDMRSLSEFFNLFNHPAFGNPGSVLATPGFGTISSTLSNARIVQFGLKLEF